MKVGEEGVILTHGESLYDPSSNEYNWLAMRAYC